MTYEIKQIKLVVTLYFSIYQKIISIFPFHSDLFFWKVKVIKLDWELVMIDFKCFLNHLSTAL